ncbi:hypothetical protein PIB30_094482, partial [Stylosanthes scabra]|nr:hypothetical protein [Stylosanthes scabra]
LVDDGMGHGDRTGFLSWEWFMVLDRFNPLKWIGMATDQVSVLSDLCHCQTDLQIMGLSVSDRTTPKPSCYLGLAWCWARFHAALTLQHEDGAVRSACGLPYYALDMLQHEGGVVLGFLPHLGVMSGESPRLGVAKTRSWRGLGLGSRLIHAWT